MAETMVHRSGVNWRGERWLAYREIGSDLTLKCVERSRPSFTALCDERGNVLYFDTEADARAALKNPALKTVREYLRGRRGAAPEGRK